MKTMMNKGLDMKNFVIPVRFRVGGRVMVEGKVSTTLPEFGGAVWVATDGFLALVPREEVEYR